MGNMERYYGETFSNSKYFMFVTKFRDCKALDESNFTSALNALGGESLEDGVQIVRVRHFAYGWLEHLLIREDSPKMPIALEIEEKLKDYPIVDEDHYSQLVHEQADEYWSKMVAEDRLKQVKEYRSEFSFRNFKEMLNSIRGGDGFFGDAYRFCNA